MTMISSNQTVTILGVYGMILRTYLIKSLTIMIKLPIPILDARNYTAIQADQHVLWMSILYNLFLLYLYIYRYERKFA